MPTHPLFRVALGLAARFPDPKDTTAFGDDNPEYADFAAVDGRFETHSPRMGLPARGQRHTQVKQPSIFHIHESRILQYGYASTRNGGLKIGPWVPRKDLYDKFGKPTCPCLLNVDDL